MTDDARPRTPFRVTPAVFHVLLTLGEGTAHAYGMMKRISARTHDTVTIGPGSLHYTIGKLQDAGLIAEAPAPDGDDGDARRRYYRITSSGRALLRSELDVMAEIVDEARAKALLPGQGPA